MEEMKMEIVQFILSLIVPVLTAIVLVGIKKFGDYTNKPIDWYEAAATLLIAVGIGVWFGYTSTPLTLESVGAVLIILTGWITVVQEILKGIVNRYIVPTKFYSIPAGYVGRKFNEERLHNLIFDLPEWMKTPVRACVEAAELGDSGLYAILAGNNIFLIEFGVLVGHRRNLFRGRWFGAQVAWKPIADATLTACRLKGYIPEYEYLT
jgi:hypothetical protein